MRRVESYTNIQFIFWPKVFNCNTLNMFCRIFSDNQICMFYLMSLDLLCSNLTVSSTGIKSPTSLACCRLFFAMWIRLASGMPPPEKCTKHKYKQSKLLRYQTVLRTNIKSGFSIDLNSEAPRLAIIFQRHLPPRFN